MDPKVTIGEEQSDEIGKYIDIQVGKAVQRMRWIPAGEFLMGSPEDEPERYDNEQQHPVEIDEGFWMADTACTQELWEEVMGKNPSYFTEDNQLPVEKVSWFDCVEFCKKLSALVPGFDFDLPEEAQWEYACRAGTTTPFWWGDTITTDQANYDGNYPYNGGATGEYRAKTVPVKSFKANPWGLYQVHGNVWEWCKDEYKEYPTGD